MNKLQRPPIGLVLLLSSVGLMAGCLGESGVKPGLDSGASPAATLTLADLRAVPGVDAEVPLSGDAREKAIKAYRDFLQDYPTTTEYQEIRRRLADLLVESAWTDDSSGLTDRTTPDSRSADERYSEAITIYEQLLAIRPQNPATAELLYQLAKAHEGQGRPLRAIEILQRLIGQYPTANTRLYADAQFRFGELLFGEQDFVRAEAAYGAVVKLGEGVAVYEQGLNKLGWSLLRQERYDEALEPFFTLLDRKIPPNSDPQRLFSERSKADREQIDDLFRAVSLCFSSLAGIDAVADFFERRGSRPYELEVYRHLADHYQRKGLSTDAAATWLALARHRPLDSDAPRHYLKAIRLYRREGSQQSVLITRAEFVERYGLEREFWRRHEPSSFPEVITQLQTSLVELAGDSHRQALKTGSVEAFEMAEQRYRRYLTGFGSTAGSAVDSELAVEMNFQLAELLYQRGVYSRAVTEYQRVAYERGNSDRGSEAGRSALKAYAQQLKLLEGEAQTLWFERFTESQLRFVRTWPEHRDAVAVFSRAGSELLDRGRLVEVAEATETLLQQQGVPVMLRQVAWTLLARARFQQQDYPGAEHGYRQALGLAAADDVRRTALREVMALAVYRQAEAARDEGDQPRAAELFLRAAADGGSESSVHPRAQYDGATSLLVLERWDPAIRVLQQFRDDHPGLPLQQQVLPKLAFAYDRGGRRIEAADAWFELGRGQRPAVERRQALLRAAELYQQLDRIEQAQAALERYVGDFPKPVAEAVAVRRKLADLAHSSDDEPGRKHWLMEIIRTDRFGGDDSTAPVAAQASLSLAEEQVSAFERIRLTEPLQQQLTKKLQAMKRALKALEAVTDYGVGGTTTAATYRIAGMYHELGDELLNSERPRGLNDEELAQYELLLEEQAAPFEEQAISYYQTNVSRISGGQYDAWIEQSLKRLAELWPARYAKEERSETTVEALD
ncbi:tetratricopeptide repeat protein [Motiliproteus coralliicola]|nr:tetratricopeptide repeat protein [Motiliproteus coralliicola]